MPNTENTAQIGVNAVERIFLEMKWIFRRQLESDFGVDAQVEVVDKDGRPTGQLIGIQIKSGSSFFRKRGEDYVFYGKERHLNYWDNHCLPILLILHNPDNELTLWQRVERHLVTEGDDGSWSIVMPAWKRLEPESDRAILESIPRSDLQNDRRNRMMLDADLIRRVAENGQAYVTVQEWINKTLNFRQASLSFDEPRLSNPDHGMNFYLPANSPSQVFDWLFPWLDFEYLDAPRDDDGEVMNHVFDVKLNKIGRAFLILEDYYRDGIENPDIEIPEPTGELMDEVEWREYQFRKALESDWEDEAKMGPPVISKK